MRVTKSLTKTVALHGGALSDSMAIQSKSKCEISRPRTALRGAGVALPSQGTRVADVPPYTLDHVGAGWPRH